MSLTCLHGAPLGSCPICDLLDHGVNDVVSERARFKEANEELLGLVEEPPTRPAIHLRFSDPKFSEEHRVFEVSGLPDEPAATHVRLTGRPEAFAALEAQVADRCLDAIMSLCPFFGDGTLITRDRLQSRVASYLLNRGD